ncbi:MAG: hypothetical protein KGI52_01850 [Burkholderiales bacterium]|nr:hypothetical protein [Burkholderiales bacterium]
MSKIYSSGFVTITMSGFSAATGAGSAATAIPVASDGNLPRYIRVAARNECYVKLGTSSVTATANDILVQPADSVILQVPNGITHIAYIQGTAAGQVNVTPLEQC